MDGISIDQLVQSGAAVVAPAAQVVPIYSNTQNRFVGFAFFDANQGGYVGRVPNNTQGDISYRNMFFPAETQRASVMFLMAGAAQNQTGGTPQNPTTAPTPKEQPDPKEIERLINSCLQNLSIVPENYYNAIRDNKRDAQSLTLSLAHAATESSFTQSVVEGPFVGRDGERGLFQIKLPTANGLGLGKFTANQLYDPALNTRLGTTYLQNLINSFGGDVRTALGAYKQGRPNVLNNGLSKASQEYADGILGCERAILGGRR